MFLILKGDNTQNFDLWSGYAKMIADEKGVLVHTSTPEEKQAFKDAVYRKHPAKAAGQAA